MNIAIHTHMHDIIVTRTMPFWKCCL